MNTNYRITGTIELRDERLLGSLITGAQTAVNVTTGTHDGRHWLRLQGMARTADGKGWGYHGREVLVPLEQAGELAALIQQAAGITSGQTVVATTAAVPGVVPAG